MIKTGYILIGLCFAMLYVFGALELAINLAKKMVGCSGLLCNGVELWYFVFFPTFLFIPPAIILILLGIFTKSKDGKSS